MAKQTARLFLELESKKAREEAGQS